jgi:2-polyprenyl-6-methoxyphenol hydroxylase-like FAD-dependent oxidoreductase
MMNTEVTDIIKEKDTIVGLRAKNAETQFEIYAELVVAADGRHSTVREKSQLIPQTLSAPMDVLWFRLERQSTDPKQTLGKIESGKIIIMLERGDYWQCGFLIRKNQYEAFVKAGMQAFHHSLEELLPHMRDRIHELTSWEQIKLLQVTVDRLPQWYQSGLLCIGDAAHAMSPIGGVGINLAIQDAVASANILIPAFLNGLNETHLQAIQKRREFPTHLIQGIQVFLQNRIIDKVLGKTHQTQLPFIFKLLQRFPLLRRIPAYLVGMGFRPEHIKK